MKQLFKLIGLLSILTLISAFVGCGYLATDEGQPYEKDFFYEPGAPVNALSFDDAKSIKLYRKKEDMTSEGFEPFELVKNGDYMTPGEYSLGIKVDPRLDSDGKAIDQRMFVSDGGKSDHVEAIFHEASGYYICDFTITDAYITHPILIQAIYPDSYASKEKFVVITRNDNQPEAGMLVKDGLDITLSAKALDGLKEVFGAIAAGALGEGTELKSLTPAANNSGGQNGIFHMDMGTMSFDLGLNDTDQSGIRGMNLEIEDIAGGEPDNIVEGIMSMFISIFLRPIGNLLGISLPMGPVSLPLSDLLAGLGGSDDSGEEDLMATLMGSLEMDSTLFLNVFGRPEETDPDFAVIGVGLYIAESTEVKTILDAEGNTTRLWPEVEVDTTDTQIDLSRVKKTDRTDLGIALSQYNLNHMLSGMMRGFTINMPAIEFPLLSPPKPSVEQEWSITINPEGIAIDMNHQISPPVARLVVTDLRWVFIENGTNMAEVSVDLAINMALSIQSNEEGSSLLISTILDLDLCHFHILKSNLDGIALYDHSQIIQSIFMMLRGADPSDLVGMAEMQDSDEPFSIPISLTDLGIVLKDDENTSDIEFDGNGNCYMSLAVDTMDLSSLPIGCFISAAQY